MTETLLVDKTNYDKVVIEIISALKAVPLIGLDIETQDSARHPGLNRYNNRQRHAFDLRRTVVTGLSLWPEDHHTAYYLNLSHADVENRLTWNQVKLILDSKPADTPWICHNAPFEIANLKAVHDYNLLNVLCSLQLCATVYGPDNYDFSTFRSAPLSGMKPLLGRLINEGQRYNGTMTSSQQDLLNKITAKESDAGHSYNGFVKEIAYGFGLKKAVKSFFNYDMVTYEEVLGKKEHMGQLTGEEVANYGAEDAIWCVKLFRHVLTMGMGNNPAAITTYFTQENPLIYVFADVWRNGMRVTKDAITARRLEERKNCAVVLRQLRAAVRDLLPFDTAPDSALLAREAWYAKNFENYRSAIEAWAYLPDSSDDFTEVHRVRGPVSNAWAAELGKPESSGPNLSHYMPMRVLLYDLAASDLVFSEGKVQSDGEARGKIKDANPRAAAIVDALNELGGIEQRVKLFLEPYEMLVDPDTSRLHPVVTSMLATRRMAARMPNPMQLSKRGSSTYVRGFFVGDTDEELVVSLDLSGIELVLIGEFSGDPVFAEAYGQLPHKDMHSGTSCALLGVELGREVPLEDFKRLPRMSEEEVLDVFGDKILINSKGQKMTPSEAYKFHRGNDGGKGANFNYWYSGALATIAEKRGWTQDQMWEATEAYRELFWVAEQWRVNTIQQAKETGFVTLPDGLQRIRYEATDQWNREFVSKFQTFCNDPCYINFIQAIARKIQRRANNQAVNALIQGSCATLIKRSILKARQARVPARFMMPVHDELLFSAHYTNVVPVINAVREILCSHPDIVKNLKMDSTPSIGLTFEPYHPVKAPFGQVELYECPEMLGFKGGSRLNDDQIGLVVDYMMAGRKRMAA